MQKLILALDQGTTGSTAVLMDTDLNVVAEASQDFEQHFVKPGWVEHQPEQILKSVQDTVKKVTAKVEKKSIVAIGITNQRETICFWDRETGETLTNAIVWQDRRTTEACEQLKARNMEPFFQDGTGLLLDPYFSGTKVAWAIKNIESVKNAYAKGRLAVGTMDSFLIYQISGKQNHCTEPSNASRTLAFHLHKHKWDRDLCSALGVNTEIWPEIKPSMGTFGLTRGFADLPDGIPITGVLGDQQSALLGQACTKEGMAKCTYGTGAFILMNSGKSPVKSRHRLLSTVAWCLPDGQYTYALEGSSFIAGAAVQWLRDGLGIIQTSAEVETLAATVPSSEGVVFVPALTGLGAPYWNPRATGLITGITRGTNKGHIARAALEGVALQVADILIAMQKDLQKQLVSVNVDGGASANNLLMQFQSDVLGIELRRPQYLESTSLGAVFAAGIGAGIWKDLNEVSKVWKMDRSFKPEMDSKKKEEILQRWKSAVEKV